MKKYPTYKTSGVDWLGEIPNNWNSTIFNRVLKEIKDGTHGSFKRVEEGRVLLSAKNVQSDKIDITENESLICEDDYISIVKNGFPQKNDLLLTIVGTIGRAFVYDLDYPLAFQRSVAFLRFKKNNNIKFYYYQVQSNLFLSQLFSLAKTSAQSGVYLSDIKGSIALVPPLFDQNLIVRFLDYKTAQIDSFIANRQKQIDLLKEQLHFKINEAITKGINSKVNYKPTDILYVPEIPEHWEIRKFNGLTTILTCGVAATPEYVEESEGVAFLSAQNCRPFAMDLAKYNYIKPALHKQLTRYKKPQRGDVLVTRVGAGIGQACMVDIDLEFSVYVSLTHIRPNKEILSEYIVYFFNTEYCYQLNHEGTVVAGGQGNLNVKNVERYRIPLPPIDEQREIIAYLDNYRKEMDNLISKYQRQIELMQEYRTSLISQAVTGKIDVRDWKPKK